MLFCSPQGNDKVIRTGRNDAGDLHVAPADVTGDKPGIVVCEEPAKPLWCEVRTIVFGWTRTHFPLHIRSTRKLTLNEAPNCHSDR
jgi:hypothetical protein